MNDPAFILSLQNGEPAAFRQMVETWQHMVYNTVLGIVQDVQEAEDVTQEVFIQVYQSVHGFRGESKLSTWVYRIAVMKALDAARKRKAKKRLSGLLSFFGGSDMPEAIHFHHPGVQAENRERSEVLFKAINTLPQNQRIAFLLIRTEGLTYDETAEIMEITVKAVEALMHRSKENLRKKLKEYYHT